MKKTILLALIVLSIIMVTGCRNKAKETTANVTEDKEIVAIESDDKDKLEKEKIKPTEDLTKRRISILTGNYISEEIAERRPVAVVINNLKKAMPQSGLSQADIIYEVLAEGDITRLIAIFQDFNSDKIGPVRSARHYFLNFASDNDAIFVHHGGSTQGYADIAKLKVNNLDGMKLEGISFWRDPVRVKQSGMYEHSSYTNAKKILEQAEKQKYRMTIADGNKGMFNFYDVFSYFNNENNANTVKAPFSSNQNATFVYDATNKTYSRYQYGVEHIDEETGRGLTVSNIIIQLADMYVINGDEYGRREVKLISNGDGYLISGGKYVPITWRKDNYSSQTQWFDKDGNKLSINRGKTWICVFDRTKDIIFE